MNSSLTVLTTLICLSLILAGGNAHAEKLWEQVLYDGRDPFSAPHTKLDCANWARPLPGTKICVGHRVQCKYIKSRVIVWIKGPRTNQVEEQAIRCGEDSLQAGWFAALPQLILSLGASGWDTFLSAAGSDFASCVGRIVSDVQIGYDNHSHREGRWGSC